MKYEDNLVLAMRGEVKKDINALKKDQFKRKPSRARYIQRLWKYVGRCE